MTRKVKILCLVLVAALLCGCSLRTVDQLYCLPKRSESYMDLQEAIDRHMEGLSYCAPLSGENPQSVQRADLDGDGEAEYLLFAKGSSEKPLHILIFRLEGEGYVLSDTIVSTGSAYDVVAYARMDDQPGLELIVGRQVSDQVARSVSVYRFVDGKAQQLMSANYTRFLSYDMDADGRTELVVLRSGSTDETSGVAELYRYRDAAMERSNEVSMSAPVDRMKRIVTGRLQDGAPAVYVASAVGEQAIITDVFSLVEGVFTNVSLSVESGTSVQTLRNYYIYADDIDKDGIVELPGLITMEALEPAASPEQQYLIRWFAMTSTAEVVEKGYTFHDFRDGWYLELDRQIAPRITVVQRDDATDLYLWNEDLTEAQRLMSVYVFTGSDREEAAVRDNRFILYEGEDTIYSAYLEVASASYGLTQESLIRSFRLIRSHWNTGET
ncbi:MAG: hypothetical protein IJW45_00775 [Oscillospiraceae bacterium]|nr:hypothetical protein [Oscillospiraceae bacterium]